MVMDIIIMPEMIDTCVLFVTALDGKGTKIDQKKL
jgi:hypothetical protein